MKVIIYLFFLLTAGAASVCGQSAPPASPLPRLYTLLPRSQIRILQPDNMPCLVPNPDGVERMPVRRMTNTDRMPNGYGKPGIDRMLNGFRGFVMPKAVQP